MNRGRLSETPKGNKSEIVKPLICHYRVFVPERVLLQKQEDQTWGPVMFISRALDPMECRCAQMKKEALALAWARKRFSNYIPAKSTVAETEHKPLVPLLTTETLHDVPPTVHWLTILFLFPLNLLFRKIVFEERLGYKPRLLLQFKVLKKKFLGIERNNYSTMPPPDTTANGWCIKDYNTR